MNVLRKSVPLMLATLFTFVAGASLLYVYGRITAINEETAGISGELTQSSQKEEQLRGLKALLGDTASARREADTYFVGQDGVVDFLKTIEEIGRTSRVDLSVDSVNVEKATKTSVLEGVPIAIKLSGTFGGVMRYLYQFEKLPIVGGISFARFTRFDLASSTQWSASITAHFSKLAP